MCQSIAQGGRRCKLATVDFARELTDAGAGVIVDQLRRRIQPAQEVPDRREGLGFTDADVIAAEGAMVEAAITALASPTCAPYGRTRRNHFWCELAAAIGQACAGFAAIPGDLVSALVRQMTPGWMRPVYKAVVKALLDLIPGVDLFSRIKQVGHLADSIAVDLCRQAAAHGSRLRVDQWLADLVGQATAAQVVE